MEQQQQQQQQQRKRLSAAGAMKRIRIAALDGIRGLLALHIVLGHFLRFAGPPECWKKFFAQVNVTVGAFFALSGYVTAYTCTVVGAKETSASFRALSLKQWWMSRAMTFYRVHWFVLLLFGPMFVYTDFATAAASNNGASGVASGLATAATNGILSVTLTQAWFPVGRAEIWNAPTWFLSSLSFCNAVLAMALPRIAAMHRGRLRAASRWLYGINLLPSLVYFWFVPGSLGLVEGTTPPNEHPSPGLFNILRFFPMFNAPETLMGAVACRMVMMDDNSVEPQAEDGRKETASGVLRRTKRAITTAAAVPFGITMGVLIGRALDWIPDCSDLFVRKFVFLPAFLNLVMALHRDAVRRSTTNKPNATTCSVSALLSTKSLLRLGSLSFPIYILHGPIGQVFYKRAVATKLWGGVLWGKGYFALYLASVALSAILVRKLFSARKQD